MKIHLIPIPTSGSLVELALGEEDLEAIKALGAKHELEEEALAEIIQVMAERCVLGVFHSLAEGLDAGAAGLRSLSVIQQLPGFAAEDKKEEDVPWNLLKVRLTSDALMQIRHNLDQSVAFYVTYLLKDEALRDSVDKERTRELLATIPENALEGMLDAIGLRKASPSESDEVGLDELDDALNDLGDL